MKNVDRQLLCNAKIKGKINNEACMGQAQKASVLQTARRCLLPTLISSLLVTACGGNGESNAPDPVKPPQYQADETANIGGLVAYYDFELRLSDASFNSGNAEPVGPTTEDAAQASFAFDRTGGIHALSEALIFEGVSGLLLPSNIISYPSYSVSMWVNPEPGNQGPLFFAESERGTLLLDANGLTVSGATGFGTTGNESLSFPSDGLNIEAGVWSHVAFSVDEGFVDVYLNGERVYRSGDYLNAGHQFGDGRVIETDAFADLFSGTNNIVAVGVKSPEESAEPTPFAGRIDNLRIYNEALYFGNMTVLSREAANEGPSAVLDARFDDPDVTVSWELERIEVDTISLTREEFSSADSVTLPEGDDVLADSSTEFTDTVPPGGNYRYSLSVTNPEGKSYTTPYTDYLRVPGSEPYAAVNATFNEDSGNIELALYMENIALASYDILRNTAASIEGATPIATGVTSVTYTDAKDDDFPLDDGVRYFYWVTTTDAATPPNLTTSLALPTASALTIGAPSTIEEGGVGFCGADGVIESNHLGFSGLGFVNTDNRKDAGIRWSVNVETAGDYNMIIRHANGSAANRDGDVTVNDVTVIEGFPLAPTDGWADTANEQGYEDVVQVISLEAGTNNIALIAITDAGLSNIDSLRFEALEEGVRVPRGIPCTE